MSLRKRSSRIWNISTNQFKVIVKEAKTLSDIIRKCGLQNIGGNHKTVLRRIEEEAIDISHIPRGLGSNKQRPMGGITPIPLEQLLCEHSRANRKGVKKRLISSGLLQNICAICGLKPEWNGKSLVLRLDHENGINDDNRLENLRLLCPNCDSQTETFAGRNLTKWRCILCFKKVSCGSTRCQKCSNRFHAKTKIQWPSMDELRTRVAATSALQVSKELGVSDRAVRKRLKK
jgi:hypothetical protein